MSTATDTAIAIVGPGAIGTTVAAALHEVGRTPLLCGRTPRSQLTLQDGDRHVVVPGPVRTDPGQVDRKMGLVFLAVKATQTETASGWLAALCGPDTVVCVLQNGVEQMERVAMHAPPARIVPAVVWFPAQAQADGSVRLRGDARLSLPDVPASRVVAEALSGTQCAVDITADFSSVAWRKLLQNAVAGLMALTHRRAGMFARPDIAQLSLAYLQECLAVARAEGARLGDDVPQEILAKFQASSADLSTSILTDREAGRPLEWDIRNGVVSRRARAHGIPTPISDIVVSLLAAASDGPG
ncbi:2-dehydropantoate 2-reductase [Achromobacter sp. MYb9]|jgi:2-dehydropantoate 2-reductase|uniref:oxidoreductase n=1 Tax=Achromobacter sp. MYb9 TaxID=1827284 RepID=UPI000CFC8EE4|nr:oxidoreductase [Achromobacter sp. MYb9]PQZ67860.1 2-dehydropantoate 2-reductase [Achromobacter sp. MYb9]